MSKSKLNERLARVLNLRTCPDEGAAKYATELRQIAEDVAEVETTDRQSKFFKALSDETRLKILKLLKVREICVCEVMVALGLTQPTASHHIGILENAGLVKNRKEGKWAFYSIANPKLIEEMHRLNIF